MVLPTWAGRAVLAIVSADAPILTLLVDQKVISALVATDIGAIIAALVVGYQGHRIKTLVTTPAPPQ